MKALARKHGKQLGSWFGSSDMQQRPCKRSQPPRTCELFLVRARELLDRILEP